jgi:hypothetical protein
LTTNGSACYDKYPFRIVFISGLFSLLLYAAGAYIMFRAGWIWLLLYILYILWLEGRLLTKSCVNCYYYGKVCAFGKGKLCAVFFKQGDTKKFNEAKITWASMLPDLLVALAPVVTAIVLMVIDFSWVILVLMLVVIILTSAGNGFVRGSLACKYCRQREIGCPAVQLFDKANTS